MAQSLEDPGSDVTIIVGMCHLIVGYVVTPGLWMCHLIVGYVVTPAVWMSFNSWLRSDACSVDV